MSVKRSKYVSFYYRLLEKFSGIVVANGAESAPISTTASLSPTPLLTLASIKGLALDDVHLQPISKPALT